MKAAVRLLCLLALLPAFYSCFTGIESTPRIQDPNRRGATQQLSPEDLCLESVKRLPPAQWLPGKEFLINDSRFFMMPGLSSSVDSLPVPARLRFKEFRSALTYTADSVIDVVLINPRNPQQLFVYRTSVAPDAIPRLNALAIPFAVECDMADEASSILSGKNLFLMTRQWAPNSNAATSRRRKFIPVTVDSVTPGDETYPLRLCFSDSLGANVGSILINPESYSPNPHAFSSCFSFSNPRDRFPAISDDNWHRIVDGSVAPGMTVDEVRLSLGRPAEINYFNTASLLRQRWTYSDGRVLFFEEGLLVEQ